MHGDQVLGTRVVAGCIAVGFLTGVIGCAGSATTSSGMRLKRSAPTTSCGTGRALSPAATDTVDAEWLTAPMRVLSYADPVYPESALNSNQGGEVEVRVLISPEGTIANVVDVKGPDIFRAAALEAVNGAELTPPTSIYGQSVVVCGTLVVSFQPAHGGLSWLNLRTGP